MSQGRTGRPVTDETGSQTGKSQLRLDDKRPVRYVGCAPRSLRNVPIHDPRGRAQREDGLHRLSKPKSFRWKEEKTPTQDLTEKKKIVVGRRGLLQDN